MDNSLGVTYLHSIRCNLHQCIMPNCEFKDAEALTPNMLHFILMIITLNSTPLLAGVVSYTFYLFHLNVCGFVDSPI